MSVVLDAGALIAFERGDGRARALVAEARPGELVVPASVLGQVWRGDSRQARLASLLRSDRVRIAPLGALEGKAIGALLAWSRTRDVVDAHVVLEARRARAVVATSDPDDLRRIDPQVVVATL